MATLGRAFVAFVQRIVALTCRRKPTVYIMAINKNFLPRPFPGSKNPGSLEIKLCWPENIKIRPGREAFLATGIRIIVPNGVCAVFTGNEKPYSLAYVWPRLIHNNYQGELYVKVSRAASLGRSLTPKLSALTNNKTFFEDKDEEGIFIGVAVNGRVGSIEFFRGSGRLDAGDLNYRVYVANSSEDFLKSALNFNDFIDYDPWAVSDD